MKKKEAQEKYEGQLQVTKNLEIRVKNLTNEFKTAREEAQKLKETLNKPIKMRKEKVEFVNSLKLEIKQTNNLALIGPPGVGKSTFLWLLGKTEKPIFTMDHGTKELSYNHGFTDTIGVNWNFEELLKLLTLFVYEGIPSDIIGFTNSRVELMVSALGVLGITTPMIVIIKSETFWKLHNKKRIILGVDSKGCRRVQPEDDLDDVYNLDTYKVIKDMSLAKPITHHDDIDELVKQRKDTGINPFNLILKLGSPFISLEEGNSPLQEYLFRLIYLFEKIYKKDKLAFMKNCHLEDFQKL